jgi:hypothetical protein
MTLTDGSVFSTFCGEAFGMPARPLTDQDLARKFMDCLIFANIQTDLPDPLNGDLLALAEHILVAEHGHD